MQWISHNKSDSPNIESFLKLCCYSNFFTLLCDWSDLIERNAGDGVRSYFNHLGKRSLVCSSTLLSISLYLPSSGGLFSFSSSHILLFHFVQPPLHVLPPPHLLPTSPPPHLTSSPPHLLPTSPPPHLTSFPPHLLPTSPPSHLTSFPS